MSLALIVAFEEGIILRTIKRFNNEQSSWMPISKDNSSLLGQRDERGRPLRVGEAERDPCVHWPAPCSGGSFLIVGGSVNSRLPFGSSRPSSSMNPCGAGPKLRSMHR